MKAESKDPRDPATCKSCGAMVIWALYMKKGEVGKTSKMPMDFKPDDRGKWRLVIRKGRVWALLAEREYVGKRFEPHFATCPNADQHRKK